MIASFITYYKKSRLDNLMQMLRLLCKRDGQIVQQSELIAICQDEDNTPLHFQFACVKKFNLGMSQYNKPKMVNFGVSQASSPVIAILDSDRILPLHYFQKAVERIQANECISTIMLYKLQKPYLDVEIERSAFQAISDYRSPSNEMHKKNMFSGNTVMNREDYLRSGGMDEKFCGYGYNDTDFTRKLEWLGFKFTWLKEKELHLAHPLEKTWNEFIKSNTYNGMRYCAKWKLTPGALLENEAKQTNITYRDVLCKEAAQIKIL